MITDTPGVETLPPADLDAPEPVREAIHAARDAGTVRDQARAELKAAEAAIAQADAADNAADQAALAAGKQLPTAKAGPEAREANRTARRKADAAEANYAAAHGALTAAIVEHRDEWEAELAAQIETDKATAAEALETFSAAYDRTVTARRATAALGSFVPGVRQPWFGVDFGNPRREGSRERKRARALQVIENNRRVSLRESDVDQVLLELELLATDSKPWLDDVESEAA